MLRWVWSVNKFGCFFFLQTQALMVEFTEIKILKKKKCTKAKLAMKVPSLRFKNQTKIKILKKILTITCINEKLNEGLFYGKWEEPMHELKIIWCFLIVNRRFKCYLYD